MDYQIFISYRRKGSALNVASLLNELLTDMKYQVFLDVEENRRLGDNWEENISAAVDSSEIFLVLISPETLEPDYWRDPKNYMREEIRTALSCYERDKKSIHIIPLVWPGCHKVLRYGPDLPDEMKRLYDFQWIDFLNGESGNDIYQDFGEAWSRLIDMIKPVLRPGLYRHSDFHMVAKDYDSSAETEVVRLHTQAKFSVGLDRELLEKAYGMLGKNSGLTALDIGCADGFVTIQRLTEENGFSKVVGIDKRDLTADKEEYARQEAGKATKNLGSFSFYQLDVEDKDRDLLDELRWIQRREGVEDGFDVVFLTFTLHHLQDPVRLLRAVNQVLSENGVVIARGIDDEAQVFYAYDKKTGNADVDRTGLLRTLVNLSIETPGMSKRYNGRQMYAWFRQAGYQEIETAYSVADNVSGNRREHYERGADMFEYNLSFRRNYTQRALEKKPGDLELESLNNRMSANLFAMRDALLNDPDSYYMVVAFGMIAKKYTADCAEGERQGRLGS